MTTEQKPLVLVMKKGLDDVNLILSALGELPAKLTYNMIKDIEQQVRDQQTPAEVKESTP